MSTVENKIVTPPDAGNSVDWKTDVLIECDEQIHQQHWKDNGIDDWS